MIFNLFVFFYMVFELDKIARHNFFFRIQNILLKYNKQIIKRSSITFINDIIVLSYIDLLYYIICLIGLFTNNVYLFFLSINIPIFVRFLIYYSRKKLLNKIVYIIGGFLNFCVLCLILINNLLYNLEFLELIEKIINLF